MSVEIENPVIEVMEARNAGICDILRSIGDNGIDRETGMAALAMLDFNFQAGKTVTKPVSPLAGGGRITFERAED